MNLFLYRLKVILKNKATIFWTLVFPICLACFYSLAFSSLYKTDIIDNINICVIGENEQFEAVLNGIDIISINKVKDEEEAKALLFDEVISGYYIVSNNDITLVIVNDSIKGAILENIVSSYKQNISIYENILVINETNINFLKTIRKNYDYTVIYFYVLIAMVCLYSAFFSVEILTDIEPLSKRGARFCVSPVSKAKILVTFSLSSLVVHLFELSIILLFINKVLNVSFNGKIIHVVLLCIVGSICGFGFGFMTVFFKKSEEFRGAIVITTLLSFSFLSGMMIYNIKYLISMYVPFINYINPIALITDGFYVLYYYDTYQRFYLNIFLLLIISLVFFGLFLFYIRRKKYDSI